MGGRKPESYYRPRRSDITAFCAIMAGIFGGLWAGASQWFLLLRGVRRDQASRGLFYFEFTIVRAVIVYAILGAALGWTIGFAWERWHRKRRMLRRQAQS